MPFTRIAGLSILVLSSIQLALSGCSTIHGSLVAPEIESPTITAAKRIDFNASIAPSREILLYSDASARPPTTRANSIDRAKSARYGGLSYGLPPPISISGGLLGTDALIDGVWGGTKVQLFGNRGWIAEGAFQLAAFARIGYSGGDDEGDRNGEFGPHGFPWESERSSSFAHIGASIGYLIGDWLLPFIGVGTGTASTEAEITQKQSTDGVSSVGGTYRREVEGDVQSLGAGAELLFGERTTLSVGWHRSRFETLGQKIYDSKALLRLEMVISQPD
jgi:hypothetical protein